MVDWNNVVNVLEAHTTHRQRLQLVVEKMTENQTKLATAFVKGAVWMPEESVKETQTEGKRAYVLVDELLEATSLLDEDYSHIMGVYQDLIKACHLL